MKTPSKYARKQHLSPKIPFLIEFGGGSCHIPPGIYDAVVPTADEVILMKKYNRNVLVLEFFIAGGEFDGSGPIRAWINASQKKPGPASKLFQWAVVALGRNIEPGEIMDPKKIFGGKIYRVEVETKIPTRVDKETRLKEESDPVSNVVELLSLRYDLDETGARVTGD